MSSSRTSWLPGMARAIRLASSVLPEPERPSMSIRWGTAESAKDEVPLSGRHGHRQRGEPGDQSGHGQQPFLRSEPRGASPGAFYVRTETAGFHGCRQFTSTPDGQLEQVERLAWEAPDADGVADTTSTPSLLDRKSTRLNSSH